MENKSLLLLKVSVFLGFSLIFLSCQKEETGPPSAQIFYSAADYQVAFTPLAKNANSYSWDFGDGEISNEFNPVHIYAAGGTYDVKLTVTGNGETAEANTQISIALTKFEMLTGGPAAVNGRTWKISSTGSATDAIALADANMTPVQSVPGGALGLIGLNAEYDDEFTFKYDGSYSHDVKNGGALAGLVFSIVNQLDILTVTGDSQDNGLAISAYTPETGATFNFTENTDLTLDVVSQMDGTTASEITYPGVTTLAFSGTEFIGLMDFTRTVIIQDITKNKMKLAMFMSATQGAQAYKPSLVLQLTFDAVN